jgi:short-subunit dehydrogenase
LNGFPVEVEDHVIDLGVTGAAERVWSSLDGRSIHILINNAGFGLYGFFKDTDWSYEESMLNLHILTVTRLVKLVLPQMIERGSGRIMNVSSLAAFQPGPLMSVYYASKAYMLSFSEALANEVKGTGVTVTVVAPGWFKTNFQKSTAVNSGVEESKAKLHTATAEKVASRAYSSMLKGKSLVIPGFKNRLMSVAPRFIPRNTMTALIRRIQERLRK